MWEEIQELKYREGNEERFAELQETLDQALLANEDGNDDNFNLSKALDNYTQVNIDLKSLGVLDSQARKGGESISDADFLNRERCLAESRLIKSKIIYKLHADLELTAAEQKYRTAWQ